MNCRHICALLILIAAWLLSATSLRPVKASTGSFGPRSDLNLYWYAGKGPLYTALKTGAIDISLSTLTYAQYSDARTDPNIILCPVPKLDLVAFSLNTNESTAAYLGVRSATSYDTFRKALWCMVDRYIPEQHDIPPEHVTPVYVPVAAPSRSWVDIWSEQYVKDHYPHDSLWASNYLDTGGFAQRAGDPNPYYNPAVPGSAQYWRGYPPGHSKAGQRIDPVIFSARVDDELRYFASVHLRDHMLESGIPVNFIPEEGGSAYSRVMVTRNYQIYSSSWDVGRFPTYLYDWLHTSRWISGGSNYHVSATSPDFVPKTPGTGRPEDITDLDVQVSMLLCSPDIASAVAAARNAQIRIVTDCTSPIPMWSRRAFYAYRNLYGVTNMDGYGPGNMYTFLSAWCAVGRTIKVGVHGAPTSVNQIYSTQSPDATTISLALDEFMRMEPYNLINDQPWLAQDWTTAPGGPLLVPSTWVDPDDGKTKSYMRYWFRDDPYDGLGDADAEWIKPGLTGGTVLADFTPHWLGGGYEFSSWYHDTEPAGALYTNYRDIKHIVCNLASKYADVYFDVSSYWSQYWPCGRLLYSVQPSSTDQSVLGWKSSPLSMQATRNFAGPIARGTCLHTLTPTGGAAAIPRRTRGTPVEVISMTIDGVLATKAATPHLYNPDTGLGAGGDYSVVGSSANGPSIRIFKNVATSLSVTYWARGDPAGYWPGNTNFQTTLAGTGPFYMTDYLAGLGGYATFMANPHYFMETPPKGEVDWYWFWSADPQPRDGYHEHSIYDASTFAYALDSSGNMIPTPGWVPACDLVAPLGVVDILDIAVMADNYNTKFGSPPPNPPP